MDLGHGHMWHKGTDKHSRLALANERRGDRHDGFGARHAHDPKEEVGELDNEPLQHAKVEHQLHQGDEDDRRDHADQEPRLGRDSLVVREELDST